MTFKNVLIFILTMGSILNSYAQSDIGVQLSSNKLNKFNFEYRKSVFGKSNLKVGLSMGGFRTHHNPNLLDIQVVNDTIVQNYYHSNQRRISLKLGLERQIKSSVFYYGFDLFTGYQVHNRSYFQTLTPTGMEGKDVYEQTIGGVNGTRTENYFVVGGFGSMGMNLPITNRFLFNVSVGLGLDYIHYLNSTKIVDPLQSFAYEPRAFSSTYAAGTVGLRYRFL